VQWLEAVGYKPVSGPAIAPGERTAERSDYGKVVLEDRLRQALYHLNPDMPDEALEQALLASGSSTTGSLSIRRPSAGTTSRMSSEIGWDLSRAW